MRNGLPTLAVCGHGRVGKDTACEWFRDNTPLTFVGGCSWAAREYMARRLSEEREHVVSPEEAYLDRHKDRDKWYRYLNEYRAHDAAALVRDVLKTGDIICGIRDGDELKAARQAGLFDLAIWIHREVPLDPTLRYTVDDCDIIVNNCGTIPEFHSRLKNLAIALRIYGKRDCSIREMS